jgi:hypothetical protein
MHWRQETLISKRLIVFIHLLIITLFLPVCGGQKETKKVSPESKLVQEAFELAETLKNAYVKKDRAALEIYSTQDAYKRLIGDMKSFDSAELTFTPTWVEIQDSTVQLSVSWKGIWFMKGKTTEEQGIAVFVLEGVPLKLHQIQRANPFRQPE